MSLTVEEQSCRVGQLGKVLCLTIRVALAMNVALFRRNYLLDAPRVLLKATAQGNEFVEHNCRLSEV